MQLPVVHVQSCSMRVSIPYATWLMTFFDVRPRSVISIDEVRMRKHDR